MRVRRTAPFAVLVATLVATACSIAALDLEGKKCPCADGYECDVPRDTCVAAGSLVSDAATLPDVQVVDTGVPDVVVVAPLVVVSDLKALWATPSSIRWEWKVTGEKSSFRAYEIVVGKSASDVEKRAAGVDVLRGAEHPELDLFDARGGKTTGPVTIWTTTDGTSPNPKFVQVHAVDVNGTTSSSAILSFPNPPGPSRTKILFDGVEKTARPADFVFKAPVGGESLYELIVACGAASSCAKRGEIYDLTTDLSNPTPFSAADFKTAFVTFEIEGNVAALSYGSTVAIELGNGTCTGGAGACKFKYGGFTQRRSGIRTTVQAPLEELRNDDGPLTYAILQQKSFLVHAFELSGTWPDKSALRLYNARIRW